MQPHLGDPGSSVARDGLPLPGLTLPVLMSQLAFRVLGPENGRARSVLDDLGLAGRPTAGAANTAARNKVTSRTMRNRINAVRAAGTRLPLAPALLLEAGRRPTTHSDALGQQRIASILGVRPWTTTVTATPPHLWALALTATQILATTGPLHWEQLYTAVLRRRTRVEANSGAETKTQLRGVLVDLGYAMPGPDEKWYLVGNVTAPAEWDLLRDALAPGQQYGRGQLLQILGRPRLPTSYRRAITTRAPSHRTCCSR